VTAVLDEGDLHNSSIGLLDDAVECGAAEAHDSVLSVDISS
jgi:hypothetical protein